MSSDRVGLIGRNPVAVEGLEARVLLAAALPGFAEQTYVSGIMRATAMVFAPDGRVFATEQTGAVRVISASGQLHSAPFTTVSTSTDGERGLVGITLDPDFSQNGYVYIYWTVLTPTVHNRVSRFTADPANPNVALANSRVDIITLPTVTATTHNGGALHFGPDGKLYVAVGENAEPSLAQVINHPFGKMLRFNSDGTIPSNNPYFATNTGLGKAVWASGLRNPFTFSFQPGTGRMFINDVGQATWEEVNDGIRGANYGWPLTEGPTSDPRFVSPIYAYRHTSGQNSAITGSAFYNPPPGVIQPFPNTFVGKYFHGDASGRYVDFIDPANPQQATRFASQVDYVVDIDLGPDGSLYVLSRSGGFVNLEVPGRIIRYSYTGTLAPSIGRHPEGVTVAVGDPATFTVEASGTGLSYQWQRNGVNIPGATSASYTLNPTQASDDGAEFRVIVSNSAGTLTSNPATLTVSNLAGPVPFITTPATGTLFVAGQPVRFSGGASDGEDGTLPASQLIWTVSYITGSLERPFMPATSGITVGSFTPEQTTPYLETDVKYRVRLTATNSDGVSRSTFVDVLPRTANVTLTSNVTGVTLRMDGVPVTAPHTVSSVAGLRRPIEAPAVQTVGGITYQFRGWSDGGAAAHEIIVPTSDAIYTATYVASPDQPQFLAPAEDAHVRDGSYATQNFGTAPELQVKTDGTGWNRHTYLKFNLTTIGSQIGSAKLRVYARLDNTQSSSVMATLYDVPSTWSESSLTWNNKPESTSIALGSFTVVGTSWGFYEVDLTSYLRDKKASGAATASIVLKASSAKATILLASDENPTAANRPGLAVTATAGAAPQALVLSASQISVPEGGTSAFTVKLASQPASNVIVSVARASGDSDLTVAAGSTLTFTPTNWNVAQSVTIAAAEDTDTLAGSATFTISASGVSSQTVTATEIDNDTPAGPVSLSAIADAYVRDGTYAGQNFGTAPELQVKSDGLGWNRHSYLTFDLTSVGSEISSARLRVQARLDNTQASSVTATLYDAPTNWSESSITWNNKPESSSAALGSFTVVGTSAAFYELDLTSYLREKKAAGATAVTVVLKAAAAKATILMASDEHSTAGNRPALLVSAGAAQQGLVVSPQQVLVPEGGTSSFTVKLAAKPDANVVVSVARTSGDTDLSVAAGSTLTFTPINWNVAQTVTLAAAEDADLLSGSAMFTISAAGLLSQTVRATEIENDTPATSATLSAVADSYIRDGTFASQNFGLATELAVKRHSAVSYTREAYLRFDLSGVSSVSSARLRMLGRLTEAATVQTAVHAASDTTWSETGITWNTHPSASATAIATAQISGTASAWYEWDLTSFIAAERAAGRTAVTLVLRNVQQTNATLLFASEEASANRPTLLLS